MTDVLTQPAALEVAATVFAAALALGAGYAAGRAARAVRDYLRDPRRPKPPLGWVPWEPPSAARRVRYYARYGWWKVRAATAALLVRLGVKNSW